MQDVRVGSVVVSEKGRDAGRVMMVVATDGIFADVCDGRKRRIEKPKRKKLCHLRLLSPDGAPEAVYAELTNGRLWKYLSPFRSKLACSEYENRID